jgi:transcriptional regulator with XRE-family HTH domain
MENGIGFLGSPGDMSAARPTRSDGNASDEHGETRDFSELGPRLLALRKSLRMNQVKFSEVIGCSQGALVNYERSQRDPPFRIVREAARFGGLSIDELALSAEEAGRYRVRAWQQAEALKQRLIQLAALEGTSLEMDGDRWNRVMELLLKSGARVGTDEGPLHIILALCQTSGKLSL